MQKEVISIIGGSGSGKDTQATLLSKKLGIPHLSMGAILREEKAKGNPLAVAAAAYSEKGLWVPDTLTSQILEDYVKVNAKGGFIITGYPRPVEQRLSFDRIIKELGLHLLAVVHIHVPDEILLERMKKQRDDQALGDQRVDMNDEAIAARLKSYHDTIGPILDWYRERGVLLDVDGTPSREQVHEGIIAGLEKMQAI